MAIKQIREMTYSGAACRRERKLSSSSATFELDKESLAEQSDKGEAKTEAAFERLA
jgi:hypothetical protein